MSWLRRSVLQRTPSMQREWNSMVAILCEGQPPSLQKRRLSQMKSKNEDIPLQVIISTPILAQLGVDCQDLSVVKILGMASGDKAMSTEVVQMADRAGHSGKDCQAEVYLTPHMARQHGFLPQECRRKWLLQSSFLGDSADTISHSVCCDVCQETHITAIEKLSESHRSEKPEPAEPTGFKVVPMTPQRKAAILKLAQTSRVLSQYRWVQSLMKEAAAEEAKAKASS